MPGRTEDGPSAGGDELDDLFDYDVSAEDIFQQYQLEAEAQVNKESAAKENAGEGAARGGDLGIDEEITVRKKRAPVAKLDIERLLSPAGIPKLRRITKERLKLKGKGHEYSDVSRLLNAYQLWLDDLYPRAKFADGLAIIEKLGHTKRMQVMRKTWIDESKPKPLHWEEEEDNGRATEDAAVVDTQMGTDGDEEINERGGAEPTTTAPRRNRGGDDDQLFLTDDDMDFDNGLLATSNGSTGNTATSSNPIAGPTNAPVPEADEPPEDELDALLAEDEARHNQGSELGAAVGIGGHRSRPNGQQAEKEGGSVAGDRSRGGMMQAEENTDADPDFGDAEAAMAEMEGMW